jgi:hypothetical protein
MTRFLEKVNQNAVRDGRRRGPASAAREAFAKK